MKSNPIIFIIIYNYDLIIWLNAQLYICKNGINPFIYLILSWICKVCGRVLLSAPLSISLVYKGFFFCIDDVNRTLPVISTPCVTINISHILIKIYIFFDFNEEKYVIIKSKTNGGFLNDKKWSRNELA